jgi:hypothetical protein
MNFDKPIIFSGLNAGEEFRADIFKEFEYKTFYEIPTYLLLNSNFVGSYQSAREFREYYDLVSSSFKIC